MANERAGTSSNRKSSESNGKLPTQKDSGSVLQPTLCIHGDTAVLDCLCFSPSRVRCVLQAYQRNKGASVRPLRLQHTLTRLRCVPEVCFRLQGAEPVFAGAPAPASGLFLS